MERVKKCKLEQINPTKQSKNPHASTVTHAKQGGCEQVNKMHQTKYGLSQVCSLGLLWYLSSSCNGLGAKAQGVPESTQKALASEVLHHGTGVHSGHHLGVDL